MAGTDAIKAMESVFTKVDNQVRDILATQRDTDPEVDTINLIMGDAVNVISTGIQGALLPDFRANITGWTLLNFDGASGSIVLDIQKALAEVGPTWASIIGTAAHPTISSADYGASSTLTGWTTRIDRNEVLRFHVTSVSLFTRLLVALRIRRLEP